MTPDVNSAMARLYYQRLPQSYTRDGVEAHKEASRTGRPTSTGADWN